jgi:hypothetical protein
LGESIAALSIGSPAALSRAALLAIGALLVWPGCPTVSTQQRIFLRGADSGSHLTLSVRGDRIVVDGPMARSKPAGCRFGWRRSITLCALAGVGSMEVDMGPSADLVEVADPLPVPLTVRLGGGSDKFVGNSEPDVCYPEGARRNRCVGGAGDDVCVAGPKNTDCVGGAGNDYCQAEGGSDGCWGGPGRDVCRMGAGQDGCHGGAGGDRLFGGPGSDQLYGGRGHDYCDGGPGVGRSHSCEAGPRR